MALKSCPNCNKLLNLVTLVITFSYLSLFPIVHLLFDPCTSLTEVNLNSFVFKSIPFNLGSLDTGIFRPPNFGHDLLASGCQIGISSIYPTPINKFKSKNSPVCNFKNKKEIFYSWRCSTNNCRMLMAD